MKIQKTHHYNIRSKDLIGIYLSEDFFHYRFKMANVINYQIVQFGPIGDRFVTTVKRPIKVRISESLPKAIKKLVSRENIAVTSMEWELRGEDTKVGNYSFSLEGIPVTVKGTNSIQPNGDGATNQIDIEITCRIPLIGKKIASLVAVKIISGIEKDYIGTKRYIETQCTSSNHKESYK